MPFLYYWRPDNHRRDRRFGFGYHLNQDSPALAEAGAGDSVWAFTRRSADGAYVLAAELVVRALTSNRAGYRYGRSRVWGDLERSRYFDVDGAADAEQLLRSLSVRAAAQRLGQAFQGHAAVRRLLDADHALLVAFARDQPEEPHVAIYPEDEFEARLLLGEEAGALVAREGACVDSVRFRYLHESIVWRRARANVVTLQEMYAGRCQVCLYDPPREYGHRLCHGHHIEWLSRGGEDVLQHGARVPEPPRRDPSRRCGVRLRVQRVPLLRRAARGAQAGRAPAQRLSWGAVRHRPEIVSASAGYRTGAHGSGCAGTAPMRVRSERRIPLARLPPGAE